MTEPMHTLDTQENVLDYGFVKLLNLSGPVRRADLVESSRASGGPPHVAQDFDADDIDPALVARTSFDQDDLVGGIVEGVEVDGTKRTREQELGLVRYLIKNKHTTPIEMIEVWFEMKMPIFVARQMVRHRTVSINEVSARYVKLDNEFYIPEASAVGVKSKSNKQGRNISEMSTEQEATALLYRDRLVGHCKRSYSLYENSIEEGVPNELARMVLPLNIYTRWVWKQDLHNLMHFLRLRMDAHAQYEIRVYANAIHTLLSAQLPDLMAIFDETT